MDFFHEFGYQNGSGIFHFGGIAAGIGLLLGGWMFFCIVRLLLRLKKLETNDQLLVLLLVAMLAVCGISYTYFHEYYLYFWLMNMPVAIAVMAVELKTEDFRLPARGSCWVWCWQAASRSAPSTPSGRRSKTRISPQGAGRRRRLAGGQRLHRRLRHVLERQRHDGADERKIGRLDAAIAG